MGLRDLIFMAKLKAKADDYKYKMRLDGISEEDAYLNLDKRDGEVFIDEDFETKDFQTAFTLKEIAEHKILRMYVQVCKLERVLKDANS